MYETQIKNSTNIRLPNQDIKLTRAKRLKQEPKQEPNKETPNDKQYDKSQKPCYTTDSRKINNIDKQKEPRINNKLSN